MAAAAAPKAKDSTGPILMAGDQSKGSYIELFKQWKAKKDAEYLAKHQAAARMSLSTHPAHPAALRPIPANVPVTPSADKRVAPIHIETATPSRIQAKPITAEKTQEEISREEQLKQWRDERMKAGLATPSRFTKMKISSPKSNIKGSAQRERPAPDTPSVVVNPEQNKQNMLIADTKALALIQAEARLLLLQLRQADASVVHNPNWWVARAKVEEEARNVPEVISLYEQALKECHSSSFHMLEDGIRSFLQRRLDSAPADEEIVRQEQEQEQEEKESTDESEAAATADVESAESLEDLLQSPAVSPAPLVPAMRDLTASLAKISISREPVSVKAEQDLEMGVRPAPTPVEGLTALLLERKQQQSDATSDSVVEIVPETPGSVIAYSPVRASKKDREALGSERVLTPVRRSVRSGKTPADAKASFKEGLEKTDYAFAPNAALAPLMAQPGTSAAAPIVIKDEPVDSAAGESLGPSGGSEIEIKQEAAPVDVKPVIKISVKQEQEQEHQALFEQYGRFDTYAPSASGAKIVAKVAQPEEAARMVAITPVRRSKRLPASTPSVDASTAAVIVPNPHVSGTPAASGRRV